MGNDAPIGTSIGQIRVEGNVQKEKVLYDLLHGYHEGGILIEIFIRPSMLQIHLHDQPLI